ncbi:hypothetical protein FGSG_13214 [Fusarium graminearum PH-1]|uniref:Chromosome 4, complete genome n=1 Tax=Gibberella zeae (strain ATCC MYA-4620 / CBS 123657 / FGSC 9075 / NRRL 31084 / PH-1) TaxID=229533 RepID=I1S8N6_GIBZE|nr:hypothetical protein FGSG_13214 [Fusarium graminearum PH-1]ESU14058.1 hypothetical protein FGSG_13214 [Fusarium graminearum PH-1]CEF85247.1 unnamed protein product [Fusarium graminearum]|eukprot:XP_011327565.1 hypothetical protein FGSG_13214 [Fusarium graminearum PH-1]
MRQNDALDYGTELAEPRNKTLYNYDNLVSSITLINKVLGIKATTVAHRTRGIHDIDEEIRWKDRLDLDVHDSGGFEACDRDELSYAQNFPKKSSAETDFKE